MFKINGVKRVQNQLKNGFLKRKMLTFIVPSSIQLLSRSW